MIHNQSFKRRTFLASTAVAVTGTALSAPAAATGVFGFTNIGVNRFDGDGDGELAVDAERVRRSVRFFSEPDTGDYITSGANVEDGGISIGDFVGSSPATLTYEYRGGADNAVSAPDEVWLRLVESDRTEHEVWRAENDDEPSAEEWRVRNVHRELRGTPDHNRGFNWFTVESDGSTTRLSEALIDDFDDDTRITRVAAGRGTFGGSDELDIRYRDPRFDGERLATFPSGRGR